MKLLNGRKKLKRRFGCFSCCVDEKIDMMILWVDIDWKKRGDLMIFDLIILI